MQKFFLKFTMFCLIALSTNAETITQKTESYDQAKSHQNFIKFTGKSTKFGMITTEFDGFPKEFSINYDKKDQKIENIQVHVMAASIDTDSDARNEKMYELCLETDKFKTISVVLTTPIDLNLSTQTIGARLKVREQETPIEIKLEIKKIENKMTLAGQSQFLLSSLAIPDPSIAIARVHDQFQLNFQIELNP
jgi:polyisoprenoid-binding protein YceI